MADNTDRRLEFVVAAKDEASAVLGKVRANAQKELDTLGSLKKGLGEESAFGNLAKIAAGSGAVAGLTLAGRELGLLADKALEFDRDLRAGKKTGAEVAEGLAKSLPVFGGLIDAGRKFRGVIDGTAAEVEGISDFNKLIGDATTAHKAAAARLLEARREVADAIGDLKDQRALIGLLEPARSLLALEQQRLKIKRELAVLQEKKPKDIDAEYGPRLSALRQAITDKDAEVAAASKKLADEEDQGSLADTAGVNRSGDFREELKRLQGEREQLQSQYNQQYADRKKDLDSISGNATLARERDLNLAKEAAQVEDAVARQRADRDEERLRRLQDLDAAAKSLALHNAAALDPAKQGAADLFDKQEEHRRALRDAQDKLKQDARAGLVPLHQAAAEFALEALGLAKARDEAIAGVAQADKARLVEAAEALRDKRAGIDKALAQARIDDLDAEAARGNRLAGIEAERLKIAQRFREEREQYRKIGLDKDSTLGERGRALLGLLASPGREAAARAAAGLPGVRGPAPTTAPLAESAFGSGAGARLAQSLAADQGPDFASKTASNTDKANKLLERIEQALRPLEALATFFSKLGVAGAGTGQ